MEIPLKQWQTKPGRTNHAFPHDQLVKNFTGILVGVDLAHVQAQSVVISWVGHIHSHITGHVIHTTDSNYQILLITTSHLEDNGAIDDM